jgi:eukaryotic-like serine/threonine-protein kinase
LSEAGFDFELLRLIGHGAYGEVYLARDRNGIYCAVKVIFRESFDHDRPFERECEGLRKFEIISRSYDNQIQILHIGQREDPKQFYYVMELADDQQGCEPINPETYAPKTLATELQRRGRLPVEECLGVAVALARALENLHENGLIHRDIKPGNIIFVKNRPKLADIGLVTDAAVTVSHVGTEGYLPPEGPSSPQADIYSLGKVLYEMSTGRHRLEFPELPTNLQELTDAQGLMELNAIVIKACEHDPRKRYQHARELVEDLIWLQRGGSLRHRRERRGQAALALKAAALLALGAVAVFAAFHLPRLTASHPQPAVQPAVELSIISAVYGSGTKFADVTSRVDELLRQAGVEFFANPQWLRADPTPGWNKALVIVYTFEGQRRTFKTGEGGHVSRDRLMESALRSPKEKK